MTEYKSRFLSALGATAALGMYSILPGCASCNDRTTVQDPREITMSYAKRAYRSGMDVKVVDFDGIERLEFYKDGRLLGTVTSINELVRMGGNWGGDGVVDGKEVRRSSMLPGERSFREYELQCVFGYDVPADRIDVIDKNGNKRTFEIPK